MLTSLPFKLLSWIVPNHSLITVILRWKILFLVTQPISYNIYCKNYMKSILFCIFYLKHFNFWQQNAALQVVCYLVN